MTLNLRNSDSREKMKYMIFICLYILFILGSCANKTDKTSLQGDYLGQPQPGAVPLKFSPKIDSIQNIKSPNFSKDGNRFLFRGEDNSGKGIFIMDQINGGWSAPKLVLRSNQYTDSFISFSPDCQRVFFTSNRSINNDTLISENYNIWYLEKAAGNLGPPKPLSNNINSDMHEIYPMLSGNNTLYFMRFPEGDWGKSDIYFAEYENGKYLPAENIGLPVSTPYEDVDPYISADESYIIFCSHLPGGLGFHDFYIYFRNDNNNWTEPLSIGSQINTKANDVCPWVTHDGRFFFFVNNSGGKYESYWVRADFINELKGRAKK